MLLVPPLALCIINMFSKSARHMKTIGHRKPRPLSTVPSGLLLAEGARFNDEIHRLPTGDSTFIPKGLYRFMTHAEANRQQEECLAKGMAKIARERIDGRNE